MRSSSSRDHGRVRTLLLLFTLCTAASSAIAQGVVTNGVVSLNWAPSARHGVVFTSVGDATEAQAFLLRAADLWQVEFRNPVGPTITTLGAADLTNFIVLTSQPSASSLTVTWSQCTSSLLPPGVVFSVTVTASAPVGEKTVVLNISIQATTASAVSLYAVSFPRVEFQERGTNPAQQVLTYPYAGGWLLIDPMHNPTIPADTSAEMALVHPGSLSMQWMGYYDRSETNPAHLFLGTRDGCGWRKEYYVHRITSATGPEFLRYRVRYHPENNLALTGSTSFTAFPSVLGMLRGTWWDAARLYRTWALAQSWCAKGPVRTSTDFSPLMKNAKMFASVASDVCPTTPPGSQCGPPGDPATFQWWDDDLGEKKSYFGADSIPSHVYFWDHQAFDAYFGNWLPAKPDFLANIPSYLSLGDPFAPYFINNVYALTANGASNSMNLPCTGGVPVSTFAVIDENGAPVVETNQRCIANVGCGNPTTSVSISNYKLDMATCFGFEYTKWMAETLAGFGARGIYLDTYTVDTLPLSYNPVASVVPPVSKPVGGGCSGGEAKVQLVESLRQYMRTAGGVPDFYTISEGQQEMFVGAFELVYGNWVGAAVDVNGQPRTRMVPLYDTVYRDHQFTSTVGAIDAHSFQILPGIDPTILIARQNYAGHLFGGRLPHAGTVLSPALMATDAAQAPAYGKYVDMIKKSMAILTKAAARDYFVFGERMRDPVTTAKTATLPGAPVSGTSVGAWYLPYNSVQPLTYAAVFKRTDLNGFAVLLLNWTDTGDVIPNLSPGAAPGSQTFQYTVNPADYGLPTGAYTRQEVVASGIPPITNVTLNGPTTFNATVAARTTRVLIFKKV